MQPQHAATQRRTTNPVGAHHAACITSVSLKIGRTSVMLYANSYRKPTAVSAGCSTQEYLGSFSVHATEIPPVFDALLRQATSGRPERYRALVERLEQRVLAPARQRHLERLQQQQRAHILGLLDFARQQLGAVGDVHGMPTHLGSPEVREAVERVVRSAQRLQAGTAEPAEPAGAGQATAEVCVEVCVEAHGGDDALAHEQAPADAPAREDAEALLQARLVAIHEACQDIAAMMPEAARRFRRGHPFEDRTVELVRQLWFSTSGAIAALNGRSQLKRPKTWDARRAEASAASTVPTSPQAQVESTEG